MPMDRDEVICHPIPFGRIGDGASRNGDDECYCIRPSVTAAVVLDFKSENRMNRRVSA